MPVGASNCLERSGCLAGESTGDSTWTYHVEGETSSLYKERGRGSGRPASRLSPNFQASPPRLHGRELPSRAGTISPGQPSTWVTATQLTSQEQRNHPDESVSWEIIKCRLKPLSGGVVCNPAETTGTQTQTSSIRNGMSALLSTNFTNAACYN